MNKITKLQRHIGQMTNTGTQVAVIMLQMPERKDSALIVELDGLPPKYKDTFIEELTTNAQHHHDLAEYLNTRQFSTGEIMLQALHNNNFLKPYPIKMISMSITDNDQMPLAEIVEQITRQPVPDPIDIAADTLQAEDVAPVFASDDITNVTPVEKTPEDLAKELLDQSKEMAKLAKDLKNQAVNLDPTMKSNRGRPKTNAK